MIGWCAGCARRRPLSPAWPIVGERDYQRDPDHPPVTTLVGWCRTCAPGRPGG